jgi:hypothetical protein
MLLNQNGQFDRVAKPGVETSSIIIGQLSSSGEAKLTQKRPGRFKPEAVTL